MFEGDDSSIRTLKKVMDTKLKLDEFEKLRGDFEGIGKEIEANDSKIEKAKRNVEKLMKEVEKIKNGSEHIANLEAGEKIQNLQNNLDREIVKLKDIIDFKKLTSIVHSNERELRIVNDYKAHFSLEFSRDGGAKILNLLGASNMKSSEINAQVSLIEKMTGELKGEKENRGLDSTISILGEVKKIEEGIDGMETEKAKVKRRLEEFDLKLQGLKNELIKLVAGFGVEVI